MNNSIFVEQTKIIKTWSSNLKTSFPVPVNNGIRNIQFPYSIQYVTIFCQNVEDFNKDLGRI